MLVFLKNDVSAYCFGSGRVFSMYPRTLIFVSMFVVSILIACGYPSAARDTNDHGKLIVQEQCTKCHNLRRVKAVIGKLDMSGWTDIVNKMERNGAKLSPEEKDAAIKFLSSAPSPSTLD
jgi:hypothetical protein